MHVHVTPFSASAWFLCICIYVWVCTCVFATLKALLLPDRGNAKATAPNAAAAAVAAIGEVDICSSQEREAEVRTWTGAALCSSVWVLPGMRACGRACLSASRCLFTRPKRIHLQILFNRCHCVSGCVYAFGYIYIFLGLQQMMAMTMLMMMMMVMFDDEGTLGLLRLLVAIVTNEKRTQIRSIANVKGEAHARVFGYLMFARTASLSNCWSGPEPPHHLQIRHEYPLLVGVCWTRVCLCVYSMMAEWHADGHCGQHTFVRNVGRPLRIYAMYSSCR